MIRTSLFLLAIFTIFGIVAFATDSVTLQGERTVYTADCQQGVWQGTQCTGTLVAGDRYRFRALKAHGEVIFWTLGASGPTSKFTDCAITDGRNWSCKPNADSPRTITHAMVRGRPVPEPGGTGRAFHRVSKTRWWLLKYGIPTGNNVSA